MKDDTHPFWQTISRTLTSDGVQQPLLVVIPYEYDIQELVKTITAIAPARSEVHRLAPDEHTIKIKPVRELLHHLSRTSFTDRRLIFIESIDRIEIVAANALLKELEESSAANRFILITPFPGRVLPTIVSRSQSIRMPHARAASEPSQVSIAELVKNTKRDQLTDEELSAITTLLIERSREEGADPAVKAALTRLRDYYKIRASRGNEKFASTVLLATLSQVRNT
ncbi:MAG: hypothetical protein WEC84_00600 [Candidatus Andersenbacteria bacterium]